MTTEKLLRIVDHALSLFLVFTWLVHEWLKQKMCLIHLRSQSSFRYACIFRALFWVSLVMGGFSVLAIGLSGIGEMPTSAAILTTALLSSIISKRIPKFSDRNAIMIRKLLMANKLRFGNPGKMNSRKYVITTRLKFKGNDTWNDFTALGFDQALPDWSVEHRIEKADILVVEECMMQGRNIDMAVVGRMLQLWLPTNIFSSFNLFDYLEDNGDLEGAYKGSRGSGLREELQFEQWKKNHGVEKGLQLWAREYEEAAERLIDSLNDLSKTATDANNLSNLFGRKIVTETREEQMKRYPNRTDWWSSLNPAVALP